MTGLWRGTGGGTRDLALKSHNSKGQEESRKVLAGGILCHLPPLNSPSLYSDSLCLAFPLVCLSFLSLFHLSFSVPLSLVYLCSLHFLSSSAWFSLSVSLAPGCLSLLLPLHFSCSQHLISTSLAITLFLPDSIYQKVPREQREWIRN